MSKGSRHYCFTINNYTEDDIQRLADIQCRYVTYGREVAPGTQTPHLQGFISFRDARTLSAVKKDLPRAHLEPKSKHSTFNQAINYCNKTDTQPYERGDRPVDKDVQAANQVELHRLANQAAREGRFNDIRPDLYVRYQNSYKRMRREDVAPPPHLESQLRYGIWIHGPSRTGKSTMARTQYGEPYLKGLNKWWDGYDGQATVLIEDYSPRHSQYLVDYLKIWVDKWAFSAETKGGRVVIRPQRIVVTSNYKLEDCFIGVDLEALTNRFEIIQLNGAPQGSQTQANLVPRDEEGPELGPVSPASSVASLQEEC